jgi:hypothetical protein
MCTSDPIKERIEKIKKRYSKILKDELPAKPMEGPEMKIHFKKNVVVKPTKIYTAAQTPIHLKQQANKALKEAIENKTVEELEPSEPSEWCSRGFFVMKPSGEARLVVDLSPLNQFIERPIHPFIPANELLKNLNPESTVYCKLDCVKGYFQIPLDEESKKLTTFLLPSGRYRYLRAPMGLSSSSDEWCKRSDKAIAGIPGVQKLVDDILIEGTTYDELFERIDQVLQRCKEANITISLQKMQIGEEVDFASYLQSLETRCQASEGKNPSNYGLSGTKNEKGLEKFPRPSANASTLRPGSQPYNRSAPRITEKKCRLVMDRRHAKGIRSNKENPNRISRTEIV